MMFRILRREMKTEQEEKQTGTAEKIKIPHGLCAVWDGAPLTGGNIQDEEHLGIYVFDAGFLFLFSVLALIYF